MMKLYWIWLGWVERKDDRYKSLELEEINPNWAALGWIEAPLNNSETKFEWWGSTEQIWEELK